MIYCSSWGWWGNNHTTAYKTPRDKFSYGVLQYNNKLKIRKEYIKINLHDQDVLCDTICRATVMLKVDFVYNQYPVFVEECK